MGESDLFGALFSLVWRLEVEPFPPALLSGSAICPFAIPLSRHVKRSRGSPGRPAPVEKPTEVRQSQKKFEYTIYTYLARCSGRLGVGKKAASTA